MQVIQQTMFGDAAEPMPKRGRKKPRLDYAEKLAFALFAPIIGCPPWHRDITDDMKARVKIERLKGLMLAVQNGENNEIATDYEAMVYLHTASLRDPMSGTWCRIYFYLFKKFFPNISDYEATVSKYELSRLSDLKQWIYRKQREAFKQRIKKEKQRAAQKKVKLQRWLKIEAEP